MKYAIPTITLIALSITACAEVPNSASSGSENLPKTQLQVREFQTRLYDTQDYKMVLKAVMNVLQDDDFIIKNANVDLGLLTATKEKDVEDKFDAVMQTLFLGDAGAWNKNSTLEASVNVSEFGKQTKVRVNFQFKLMDNKGNVKEIKSVDDPKIYQEFFAKADKGIFLQKEKL